MLRPFTVACIPAYNEEANIARVILDAISYVDQVIVCDDGSTDMTARIAEKMGATVIRHPRNLGYGAAIASLFGKAREMQAAIMVTLDGDGQHDPNDIPSLIQPLLDNQADLVIGSRFLPLEHGNKSNTSSYRKFGVKTITRISNIISGSTLTDSQSGYRAYNKKALDSIHVTERGMGASTEIIFKAHNNDLLITEVPIEIRYRKGTSSQHPLYHGADVIISTIKFVSIDHPLRFYGIPGLLFLIAGVFFGALTLQQYSIDGRLLTNIALISVGSLIIGVVLMATAIILYVVINVVREPRRV